MAPRVRQTLGFSKFGKTVQKLDKILKSCSFRKSIKMHEKTHVTKTSSSDTRKQTLLLQFRQCKSTNKVNLLADLVCVARVFVDVSFECFLICLLTFSRLLLEFWWILSCGWVFLQFFLTFVWAAVYDNDDHKITKKSKKAQSQNSN